MRKRAYIYIIGVLLALVIASSCTKISDDQIPSYPVYINLSYPGYWTTYGASSPGDYKTFIYTTTERVPSNYPYTSNAASRTGFGGVLLVCDIYSGEPRAYDLSCPVERRADVRISVDENNYEAVCSKCGSHYDVMSAMGAPLSGKAVTEKVGLSRYSVVKSGSGYNIVN